MRRFYLVRADDISGVSGLGVVAEGVHFEDGSAVVHWRTQFAGHEVYRSLKAVVGCHGHDGRTKLVWVDEITSHQKCVAVPHKLFDKALYINNGAVHELSAYQFNPPIKSDAVAIIAEESDG